MLRDYRTKISGRSATDGLSVGTVKLWDRGRGYGFLKRDDIGEDVFVHVSALVGINPDKIAVGDRVSFELGRNPKNGRSMAIACRLAS